MTHPGKEALEIIKQFIGGATEGAWGTVEPIGGNSTVPIPVAYLQGPERRVGGDGKSMGYKPEDARYIAAAFPGNMRSILSYVESLEKALKPFADIADVYDGTAVEDSDPILSTDRGKLTAGDLRSARAALKEMAE